MVRIFSIFAVLIIARAAHADGPLVARLKAAGATCRPASGGDACIFNSAPNYSQPVVFLIPEKLDQPLSLVLYLHGHRGPCGVSEGTPPAAMATRYKLLEQMSAAGMTKMVTVFPMSRGSCTDYDNSLVTAFPDFSDWAAGKARPSTDRWIVAGHSGAGRAMANILSRHKDFSRRTDAAVLLDAAYSMGSYIGRWQVAAGANRRLKIRSVYATSSPQNGSFQLQSTIPGQAKAVRSKVFGDHCNVPMADFGDGLKAGAGIPFDLARASVVN